MIPGRAGTMTHDYKRHGTTDLFAAMNVATGEVLTHCQKGHTAKDVLRFFKQIDAAVPRGQAIHVVLDNLSAHKAPEIRKWLAHKDRRRWHLHFTPTSSSWTKPGRALVQRTHRSRIAPRRLHQRPRTRDRDPALGRTLEQRPQGLHLESHRRGHHHQSPARPSSLNPPDQYEDGPLGPDRPDRGGLLRRTARRGTVAWQAFATPIADRLEAGMDRADVLIIGAGASGGVAARRLWPLDSGSRA